MMETWPSVVKKNFFSYMRVSILFQNYGKLKRVIRYDLWPSKRLEFETKSNVHKPIPE